MGQKPSFIRTTCPTLKLKGSRGLATSLRRAGTKATPTLLGLTIAEYTPHSFGLTAAEAMPTLIGMTGRVHAYVDGMDGQSGHASFNGTKANRTDFLH